MPNELCQWLITAYDVPYHRIRMASLAVVDITLADVEATMGIPCCGLDVTVHRKRVEKGQKYSIRYLESQLDSLPIGEEFKKNFLIFTCATILAPNSEPKGMHDLWDFIWDIDVSDPTGNSMQQTEDMCRVVYYSCRYSWRLICYIICLLHSAVRVINII